MPRRPLDPLDGLDDPWTAWIRAAHSGGTLSFAPDEGEN
jgi:hypothetical protein